MTFNVALNMNIVSMEIYHMEAPFILPVLFKMDFKGVFF